MLTHGNMTVYSYLQKQAKRYGDKTFLLYKDEEISYTDLLNRSNQLAHWLEHKGIKKGDIVAVFLDNSPLFYYSWFACAALGAVLLPVNTASTASELEYFLQHSESKGLIYDPSLLTEKHIEVAKTFNLFFNQPTEKVFETSMSAFSTTCHTNKVLASDVCGIMYTSGTTAKPKGVLITHENYLFAGHSSVAYQQLTSNDRYLIFLPLFHANSQYYTSMAMLVVGGSIALLEKFSASTFWDDVQKYKPTVSSFVATIIKMLLNLPHHPFEQKHNIRQIGYGLFVSQADIGQFQNRFGIHLFQWYGMTETITTNIVTPLYEQMPIDGKTGILSIGKPGLGQEVKIVDEQGLECHPGDIGEIIIRSPSLMKGYYKNEAETKKTIRDGWLYTGDKGYTNEEGFIWFVDRKKDIIKRAGENISSLEVENVIINHPSVMDCAVIGVPDDLREEAVIAFIQTNDESITQEVLKTHCEEHLSYFKVPREFRFIDEFPRTSIGKIQKNELRKLAMNNK